MSRLLKELHPNKAHGSDAVSTQVFSEGVKNLDESGQSGARKSMDLRRETGRSEEVTSIFTINREDIINYRPVSLIITVCKTVKKIFCKQMDDQMARSNYVSKSQYGFRAHSQYVRSFRLLCFSKNWPGWEMDGCAGCSWTVSWHMTPSLTKGW